jgi:hypothetical protein
VQLIGAMRVVLHALVVRQNLFPRPTVIAECGPVVVRAFKPGSASVW